MVIVKIPNYQVLILTEENKGVLVLTNGYIYPNFILPINGEDESCFYRSYCKYNHILKNLTSHYSTEHLNANISFSRG